MTNGDRGGFWSRARYYLAAAIGVIAALYVAARWDYWIPFLLAVVLVLVLEPKLRPVACRYLSTLWRYLRPCRFSLVSLVFGVLVFTVAGQGLEGLRAIGEDLDDGSWSHAVAFLAAVTVWGATLWYWARLAYYYDHLEPAAYANWLERVCPRHLPRVLGLGAFLAVAGGFALKAGHSLALWGLAIATVVLGGLFYLFTIVRRKMIEGGWRITSRFDTEPVLMVWGAIALLLLALAALAPVALGSALRADIVTVLGLAVWVPALAAIVLPLDFEPSWLRWMDGRRIGGKLPARWRAWIASKGWTPDSFAGTALSYLLFALVLIGSALLDHDRGPFLGQSFAFWESWRVALVLVLGLMMIFIYVQIVFFSPVLVNAPLVSLMLVAGLLFSFWNDNHIVRPAVEDGKQVPAPARASVASAFQDWRKENCAGSPCRPVFVATAGGGIRAALWTATVLGRLQDCEPRFGDQLFSISGVSGGALGATVFRALLSRGAPQEPSGGAKAGAACPDDWFESRGQEILGHDFLGPAIASMLLPEAIQRLLPFSIQSLVGDRAAALEQSWERGWARTFQGEKNLMATRFFDLWQGGPPWPALFLNGTAVETARRVIASNLCVGRGARNDNPVFREALDFFEIVKHDVPTSTGANVAARFPYVEPAGTLRRAEYLANGRAQEFGECGPSDISRLSVAQRGDWGHIVDGGYFENFGVATTVDVLDAIRRAAGTEWSDIEPVVVLISSDPDFSGPDVGADAQDACRSPEADPVKARQWANELMSPPATYLNLRGAIGCSAAWRLKSWIDAMAPGKGRFYHFSLWPSASDDPPALGWLLSNASKRAIAARLSKGAGGEPSARKTFEDLLDRLRPAARSGS